MVGPEIDMWSFGINLYEMAVAYKPTAIKNYKYSDGPVKFWSNDWKEQSRSLQDLIHQCIQVDPRKRITAEDAL
jgi:serine/threonine protein kinase